jgi:arginyl-tRNA synthetase
MYVEKTAEILSQFIPMQKEELLLLLERPKQTGFGDVSVPCFTLAKELKKSPAIIANELSEKIKNPYFHQVKAVGGYINIFIYPALLYQETMQEVLSRKEHFGSSQKGEDKMIVIDMSSPNIAKPFSMGHLRSTVIGNSLGMLYEKTGHEVKKINYIGDWGTQFGKLIAAYEKWGKEDEVVKNPIKELFKLYVKFHDQAGFEPNLNDEGRSWFKRLEDGDERAQQLWKWFRDLSLVEFNRIYDLLGISFDYTQGESFYNDKMERVVEELNQKKLLIESGGAQIVSLDDANIPPCLILKSDGATLYATRDLASILYRKETFKFQEAIYVVGQEQTLHFNQVGSVLEKMGYYWHNQLVHVPFGLILKDGKKMSTRKGKVVLLDEVLQEAIRMARKSIEEKNPELHYKEEVAHWVGVGSIIFHDLKHHRIHDFEFSLQNMLAFEGETGPYLQYTYARIQSLLQKGEFVETDTLLSNDAEKNQEVVKHISRFPSIVEKACREHDPSLLARLLLDIAKEFNSYYHAVKIIDQSEKQQSRLQFSHAVGIVLKEGLRLLGIKAPTRM